MLCHRWAVLPLSDRRMSDGIARRLPRNVENYISAQYATTAFRTCPPPRGIGVFYTYYLKVSNVSFWHKADFQPATPSESAYWKFARNHWHHNVLIKGNRSVIFAWAFSKSAAYCLMQTHSRVESRAFHHQAPAVLTAAHSQSGSLS